MRSSPVFPASFPAKINVFRRNRPIWLSISCCFFMKVNHIWCPPPASPSVTPFTRFWSRFGDSARRREIQTSWISSLRHAIREIKTSCIKPPDLVVLKIKTSYIAARLSVGGEIKTSYIHYIYIVYILSFLRSKPRKSSLPGRKCEIKTS